VSARRYAIAALVGLGLTLGVPAGADSPPAAPGAEPPSESVGGPVATSFRFVEPADRTTAAPPRPQPVLDAARLAELRSRARALAPQPNVGAPSSASTARAPDVGVGFDALDGDDPPHQVPPDAQLAVGPNHLLTVVAGAAAVYDKSGAELVAPISLEAFFSPIPGCAGTFDPTALYDEEANRFFVGVDTCANAAAGCIDNRYCMAVSRTADPTGNWYLYWFDTTANAGDFFDFPRAGVGDEAIFWAATCSARSSTLTCGRSTRAPCTPVTC
jgi:hypothetical protein